MKILVVDDKKMALAALSKKLSDKGCSISAVDNSLDALHVINQQKTDLLL
jgi:CheY-like chemotaxis protein